MKRIVYTALCITSVLTLPGCWCSCSKDEKKAEPVAQEVAATPAPEATTEQKAPEATATSEAPKTTETPKQEVPAKM